MRAIRIDRFGAPDGLQLADVPTPSPSAGEVLVRVEAAGVGGVDAAIRRGTLGTGFLRGMIPGGEVAGTVVEVGEDLSRRWIGTRVWAHTGTSGGYAEYATAAVADLTRLPGDLRAEDAVTVGSAATVAHFALVHARFAPGESVLVRGAAGSIGIATVEHAARRGASSIAVTTSSPERGRRLMELGATDVLDRDGRSPTGEQREYDVIIDIVGGARVPDFIDRLASNGRLVLVGAVAGFPPPTFGMKLMEGFQRSRTVAAFSLASVPAAARDVARAEQFEAAVRGQLHPVIHATLPLGAAAQAHEEMDAGSVFGRIVLTP
jgi:NADPH2:quinone reductase